MAMTTLVLYGLAYTYGLVCFVLVGVRAILDGHIFKRAPTAFWAEVESGRLMRPPNSTLQLSTL